MTRPRISTAEPGWPHRLARTVPSPGAGRARVVAVEGRSGAGKSTVAEELGAALAARGEPTRVLTMEDLYPGWEGLAEAPELLREWVLEPLARGERAAWRRYDWERGAFAREWTALPGDVAAGGVLVVEGSGSGAAAVRGLLDLLVWVAAPDGERSLRLDGRWDAGLYAPYRRVWAEQEEAFHRRDRPREHSDVVVDNSSRGDGGGPVG
ncbi:phosphoribulokinase [Nocardiopsis sp. TSRI0078]|uniref:uridine kinase family protein n=1 Tax=unclassified Nocardiopsis TaxID=2649073 RepID=UPI0009404A59|nr:phosphoribulokinase [Nocardiopsis sp. TSRI0078]OKI17198.1 phosphoribulokinase [Nocardiopsis sp. TSRI0078]